MLEFYNQRKPPMRVKGGIVLGLCFRLKLAAEFDRGIGTSRPPGRQPSEKFDA